MSAVILAGGRGSRFGGEKASAPFLGRPMVEWVVDAARAVAEEVVVCVAPGQRLTVPGYVRLVEDEAAFEGPLAGLAGGLRTAAGAWSFGLACDTPLLQPGVLRALLERRAASVDAVVPVVGGFEQPLVALYRRHPVLPAMEAALADGQRSVRAVLARLRVVRVPEDEFRAVDPGLLSFRAANTVDALRELEAVAARLPGREDAPKPGGGHGDG